MIFRMTRTGAAELPERLDVIESYGRTMKRLVLCVHRLRLRQVQQRVKQHRGVAGRQDEAIAVGPKRIGGIEIQLLLPQVVSYGGNAHGRARMAGFRFLNRIDRQRTDRVYAQTVKLGTAHASSGSRVKKGVDSSFVEPHRSLRSRRDFGTIATRAGRSQS